MNDVHAGGVKGGIADSSSPETPLDISRERFGNNPFSDQGPSKSQVAESNPMMTIFGVFMCPLDTFPDNATLGDETDVTESRYRSGPK
jgi:hypothetical protein